MKKLIASLAFLLAGVVSSSAQNYQVTPGVGLSFGSKLVGGVNYAQQTMCDPTTPANCVVVNASGQITITNTTFASTQSGTWTVQPGNTANTTAWLVTGTGGTFPATQSGTWNITNVSGTVSLPTGASTSANQTTIDGRFTAVTGTKNAGTAAASSWLTGAVYNSTPLTLTNTQQASLQADANGYLKVNVASGGAGGGAVYGPTAKGSAAANPPVVIGGTVDGTATGAVGVAKVDASGTQFIDAVSGGTMATTLSSINTNIQAPIASGTNDIGGVYNAGRNYETVAASQTAQVLGPTGATGDYLSHCVVYPATTSPGVVTVFDNTSSATNNVIAFPGGATSVSNLAPFAIPVGAVSVNGAWKVTTGANVIVTCHGKFT